MTLVLGSASLLKYLTMAVNQVNEVWVTHLSRCL